MTDSPLVELVETSDALAQVVSRARARHWLPIDIESNGLHAHRARLCTLQIADVDDDGACRRVWVVDAIALVARGGDEALAPLRILFDRPRDETRDASPTKLLHDLAFDARMLAIAGVPLFEPEGEADDVAPSVVDTAVAAQMLGARATGLVALLDKYLGVPLGKEMQHHDWGKRPLDAAAIAYLAGDVAHLVPLWLAIEAELIAADIVNEVNVETAYRLTTARASVAVPHDALPAFARIDGAIDRTANELQRLAVAHGAREAMAERRDVPVHTLARDAELIRIARGGEPTRGAAMDGELARRTAQLLSAPLPTISDADLDAIHTARDARTRIDRRSIDARTSAERRLRVFRRAEANARGVDEQVVLPGHCLRALAGIRPTTLEGLAAVGGLGRRRIERYGAALLSTLAGPIAPPAVPPVVPPVVPPRVDEP